MNTPSIMRSDDLRAENRHRILRTLRREGPLSRVQFGDKTGLSPAALSTLVGLMTEQGIVTSVNENTTVQKRGRPKTTVALDPNAGMAVAVALALDHLSFCVIDYAGNTLTRTDLEIDSRSLNEKQLFNTISSGVNNAIQPYGLSKLKAISIGFQGITDAACGQLLWSPILSIDNVPIAKLLREQFGVPTSVNNDCGLIAKALHSQEADALGDSFAAVLFSHGVGLGVYLAGEPFTGAHSSALELGHVQYFEGGSLCRCGKYGCIEAYAADYGIMRTANGLSPFKIPTGSISDEAIAQLVEIANNNGTQEKQAFELAGKAIGFGLATVFNLLDPIPVALVGRSAGAVNLMRREIEDALKTVGRSPTDYSEYLHCFHDDTPLLLDGLVLEVMSILDRVFAENADDMVIETSLA